MNKLIKTAIANSGIAVKMTSSILKHCFEVATGVAGEFKEFKEKLFNINVLNAALKLQLIIN